MSYILLRPTKIVTQGKTVDALAGDEWPDADASPNFNILLKMGWIRAKAASDKTVAKPAEPLSAQLEAPKKRGRKPKNAAA